jgi:DNA-binding MarR family transcriptional regulator
MSDLSSLERTIERITVFMAQQESQAFQEEGFAELSMRQVYHLDTILRLGHPSFGELAEALGITRPSVTAIVARLIRTGYVQKVQDHEDRRSFHIVPTEQGQAFSKLHQGMHQRIVQVLASRLSQKELEQLANLMEKATRGS